MAPIIITAVICDASDSAIAGRVFYVEEGEHTGERYAILQVGSVEIKIGGYDEIAAHRCEAIAIELHRLALELLRPFYGSAGPGYMPNAPGLARELTLEQAADAAGAALSARARAIEMITRLGRDVAHTGGGVIVPACMSVTRDPNDHNVTRECMKPAGHVGDHYNPSAHLGWKS